LKNFKIPSVWAHQTVRCAPDTALCTVRCSSRARKNFFFLCAVRCAPDRHCRLSGAPIMHFKKRPPARDPARGSHFPLCSLALFPPSDLLCTSSETTISGRAPATSSASAWPLPPSGERLFPPLCFFSLSSQLLLLRPLVLDSNSYVNLVNPMHGCVP
jgi:hypothetical protein